MAADRKYIVGQYEEYYNSLRGEGNASSKASSFISDVNTLVTEFSNISSIMTYWSGEAKDAMTNEAMASILKEFSITQKNMQESLGPACEAIDYLSQALELMKSKEDELLQAENELETLKSNEPSKEKTNPNYDKNNPNSKQTIHNDAYDTWLKNVEEKNTLITQITKELDEMKEDIDKAIKTIEDLESTLTEFSNYMNLTGSVLGVGDSDKFKGYTLEERLKYIQNIIDNYQTIYNSLNDVYQKQYGKGFSFSAEDFENLDVIFQAFDIYWMSGMDNGSLKTSGNKENVLLDIEKLNKIVTYCNNSGIFTYIEKYLDGASWKDSGLQDFYWENSPNFLKIGVFGENDLKNRLKQNYGVEESNVRSFLKEKYESYKGSYENLMKDYSEYRQLAGTMATIKEKIRDLERGKKLIPFEMEMENDDFVKYLEKDYSGSTLLDAEKRSVMTQKELALYDYLLHNKSKEEANAYMDAMENAINQRIGAQRATNYVNSLRENGFDAWDLLNSGATGVWDGIRSFDQGIRSLFTAATLEEGEKSTLDWELQYKQQFIQQLMNDPSYIDQNTNKQWHGWTDLSAWYNTGTSIGNMAIPAVVGMIPGCQGLSSALFGASIMGNTAAEAKYEGYSTAQAYIYGGVTALSEVVTEKMLGGIDGLSEKALGRNIFQNMFSEGLEEFTQEYLDLGARRLILGEKIDLSASGINAQLVKSGESFKYGAFTSGVMGIANRGTGKILNAVTKAASPVKIDSKTHEVVMESDNKTPAKKYNTYQEYKNAVESKHDVNKATKVFENTIDKVKSGQDLTLTEKVKLNNAIGDLSVQELSQVTDSLSSKTGLDTKQILQSASEGVAVLSKKSGSKFEAVDLYNQVMDENVDLKDVKFTKDDFKDEVTRDGKKLGDIIAEERAKSLTSEARANIESVSKSEMKSIDKTIDKRQKLYEKEVKKALKQELKNTTATVRENVETQSTNTDGLDTRVQQNTTTQQSSTVQQSAAVEQAAVQAAVQTQTQVEQRTQTQQNSESRQQTQVEQQGDNRVYNSAENTADVRLNVDSQTENNIVAAIQGIAQNAMQQAQAAQLQTEQTSSQETTSDSGSEVKLDTNAVKEAAGGVSLAATAAMSVNSLVGANSRASANANVDTQNNVKNNARVEGQTRTVGTATNNSTSQTQTSTRTTTDTTTRFNSDSRTSTRTNQNIEYRSSENSVVTSSDSVQNGTQTSTQLNTTALSDIKSLNTDTVSKMTGNDVANLVNEIANNPKLVQDLNSLLKDNQTVMEAFSDKLEEVFKNNNVSNLSFADAVNQANYKSTIVENLINTGLINSISDNSVAVIISSDVSSSEILNTQRAVDIFDKYIQQTSTAEAVFNMYSKADNQVLNNFLQNQEVSNTIKSLDFDLLLRVASKNSSWMNLNVLNEEISNRFNNGEVAFEGLRNKKIISDINSMNESSNTIYNNGNYSADSPQIIRYTLNTGETITIDLGDTKSGNIFDAKGINELFSQMEQKNVTNLVIKNKYNVKVLENMINNLAGERICNTYSKSYKTAEVVTTDNKTIKIELSNFVTTDNFIDIYNAVATNQVKSITINENVARNNLVLDGIDSKNVYEVTVNIDGKEQTIYTSFGDLNTNFKNVTTAEVLNVREVGNFDCEVNDVTMPVKVSFDANGVHYEKYVQPTVGNLTYEINDFIKYGGIQNVQNVQVEYVTQEQLKSTFKEKYVNYDTRPESRVLFSEQYGGNQSDVSDILTKSLNKQAMTPIEQKKAQILETISDKYYGNLTDIQKINLAEFYNTNGCFYMATANSFASYMSSIPGGEQIFKSNFGFDLFTEVDGKRVLNLEAIAYDLFLSQSEDMSYYEFLDTTPGTNFNFGAILNNYFSNHGINVDYSSTVGDTSNISEDHSIDGLKNKSMSVLLNNSNRYNILLASKFDMDQMTFDGSEQSVIKDAALANSQQIGNKRINVGGHAMLITGIDANGDIEVSSWGKKFKIDLTSYDVSKNRIDQDFHFASIGFDINQNLRFNQDSVAAVQQVAAQNTSSSMEFNSSDTAFDTRTGLDFAEPSQSTIKLVSEESTSKTTTNSNPEVVSQVESEIRDLSFAQTANIVLDGNYSDMKSIAENFLDSSSSEKNKLLSAITAAAIQNGDIDFVIEIKNKVSQSDFVQIRNNIQSLDTQLASIFENVNENNKSSFVASFKGKSTDYSTLTSEQLTNIINSKSILTSFDLSSEEDSKIVEKHLENIKQLSPEGAERYINTVIKNEVFATNPPINALIFDDVNFDSITNCFGLNIIKNTDGNYSLGTGTTISSDNMNRFVEIIQSIDTNAANKLFEIVKSSPEIVNFSNLELVQNSNFELLYDAFNNTLFDSSFENVLNNHSVDQVVTFISNSNMKPLVSNGRLATMVEIGLDVFDDNAFSSFTENELSQLGQIIDNYSNFNSEFKCLRINELINNHNESLLHDILKISELRSSKALQGYNISDYLELSESDTRKSSIYDLDCLKNTQKVTLLNSLLLEKYVNNGQITLDNSVPISISYITDSVFETIDFIENNLGILGSDFFQNNQRILEVYKLMQNMNLENATKIFELVGDSDFYDMIKSINSDISQSISNDFMSKVKESYDALDLPSHEVDGVTVYDITDQDFSLLVHVINLAQDSNIDIAKSLLNDINNWGKVKKGNPNICTSLITQNCINSYGVNIFGNSADAVIFGFSNIDGYTIEGSSFHDVDSSRDTLYTRDGKRFDRSKSRSFSEMQGYTSLSNNKQWTEITQHRYDANGNILMPDYLVTYGDVSERTLEIAKKLGKDGKPLPVYQLHNDVITKNIQAKIDTQTQTKMSSKVQTSTNTLKQSISDGRNPLRSTPTSKNRSMDSFTSLGSQSNSEIFKTEYYNTRDGFYVKVQELAQYTDPKTGDTKKIYYYTRSTVYGNSAKTTVFATSEDVMSGLNACKYIDEFDMKLSGETINSLEVKRPSGDLLVIEDGTRVLAGVKLNQYAILDKSTGKKYIVCTETDIINNINGNNQRAMWLSNSRLELKTQSLDGYIGDLRITGEIIKSPEIIDFIQQNGSVESTTRVDIERKMIGHELKNANNLSYDSIRNAYNYSAKCDELNSNLIEGINNYVESTNTRVVLELHNIELLNPNLLNNLDGRVIIKYDDLFGQSFFKTIDANNVSANLMLNSYFDVETFKSKYDNLTFINNNYDHFVNFYKAFTSTDPNSVVISKSSLAFFYNQIVDGRIDALKVMDSLTKIKQNDSNFNIIIDENDGGYYDSSNNVIHLNTEKFSENQFAVFFHEVGHCLFDKVYNCRVPSNIVELFENAQRRFSNNTEYSQGLINTFERYKLKYREEAERRVLERIQKEGYSSVEFYKQELLENLNRNKEMVNELKGDLIRQDESLIDYIDQYTTEDLVYLIYENEVQTYKDTISRELGTYPLVTAMIDHLFFANNTDLNGNPLPRGYRHSYDYFHNYGRISLYTSTGGYNGNYSLAFDEMIADYVCAKMTMPQGFVLAYEKILGPELVNELEKIYKEFMNYSDMDTRSKSTFKRETVNFDYDTIQNERQSSTDFYSNEGQIKKETSTIRQDSSNRIKETQTLSFNSLLEQNAPPTNSTTTFESSYGQNSTGVGYSTVNTTTLNNYQSSFNPITGSFPTFSSYTAEGYRITVQNLGQFYDAKTGKTLYTSRIDFFDGLNNYAKTFSSNMDAKNYFSTVWNTNYNKQNMVAMVKGITVNDIHSIEVVRPTGNLYVLENGSKILAGVKLNQYIIINQQTGVKYNVCTETDIINNINGNNQRAMWLNDNRLSLKTQNYEGYIGELRPTGEIIKSGRIIDAIERGYVDAITNRTDIERAMRDRTLNNANDIVYGSIQSAVTYSVEGSKINPDLIKAVNNYVKTNNQNVILDIKSLNNLNPNILNNLDGRVILHYDEFFGNAFYRNIDANNISINQMLNSYYDVRTFINNYNNLLTIKNNINHFKDFYNVFRVDSSSKIMGKYATAFFYNQVAEGRVDAIRIMDALTRIKRIDPSFKLVIDNKGGGYYSSTKNLIHFSLEEMAGNHYTTFFHEVGHCLFDKVLGERLPINIESLFDAAQRNLTMNTKLSNILKQTFQNFVNKYSKQSISIYEENLRKQGYKSIDDYMYRVRQNLYQNPEMVQELKNQIKKLGDEYKQTIDSYSIDSLVKLYKDLEINKIKDNLCRTDDAYSLVSGMIDHLFFGNKTDLSGHSLPHGYGHSFKYFHADGRISNTNNRGTYSGDYLRAFHEMVADYVCYQFSPNKSSINAIRAILGPEITNILDNIFNSFTNYGFNGGMNNIGQNRPNNYYNNSIANNVESQRVYTSSSMDFSSTNYDTSIDEKSNFYEQTQDVPIETITKELSKKYSNIVDVIIPNNDGSVTVYGNNFKKLVVSDTDVKNGMIEKNIKVFFSNEYKLLYSKCSEGLIDDLKVSNGQIIIKRINGQTITISQESELEGLNKIIEIDNIIDDGGSDYFITWNINKDGTINLESKLGDKIILLKNEDLNENSISKIVELLKSKNMNFVRNDFSKDREVIIDSNNESITILTENESRLTYNYNAFKTENAYYDMISYQIKKNSIIKEDGKNHITTKYGDELIFSDEDVKSGRIAVDYIQSINSHEDILTDELIRSTIQNLGTGLDDKKKQIVDKQIEKMAKRMGITKDVLKETLNKKIAEIVQSSDIGFNVDEDILSLILDSRIKNQHETGTSKGLHDTRIRSELEWRNFLLPENIDKSNSPIYGLLIPKYNPNEQSSVEFYRNSPAYDYGNTLVVFDKSKIIDYVTLTIGDSLNMDESYAAGIPVTNPQYLGSDGFVKCKFTYEELLSLDLIKLCDRLDSYDGRYVEAQIFGKLNHGIDIIQEVFFNKEPSTDIIAKLNQHNVKYTILKAGE